MKEQKLANLRKERLEEAKEERNRWTVLALYEALNARDVEAVQRLLAPDIEWWFHGPPGFQHMMKMLTGVSSHLPFDFIPLSVEPFDQTVLVEGCDNSGSVFWVHAWSVSENGVITQVREYFNTCLTVTRVAFSSGETTVWNSRLPETAGKSMPGLVLAI